MTTEDKMIEALNSWSDQKIGSSRYQRYINDCSMYAIDIHKRDNVCYILKCEVFDMDDHALHCSKITDSDKWMFDVIAWTKVYK